MADAGTTRGAAAGASPGRRAALVAALLASLGSLSPSARAELPELVWHAPAGCPSAADVLAQLSGAREQRRGVRVFGRIERDAEAYTLTLRVTDDAQRFERHLRASDCGVLTESAVFLIGLAATQLATGVEPARDKLQPRAASARASGPDHVAPAPAAPERAPLPPQPDAASSAQESAPPTAAAQQRTSESVVYLDRSAPTVTHDLHSALASDASARDPVLEISAGVGLGVAGLGLTGAAPELSLSLEAKRGALLAGLRVGTVLHSALELEPRAQLSFQSSYVALAACHDYRTAWLRTGPCAVLAGWLTFVGHEGLRDARSQTAVWLNAGGAWHVLLELHRALQLSAEVGLTVGLDARPSLAVSGTSVAQVAPVAGYGRIAYGVALW